MLKWCLLFFSFGWTLGLVLIRSILIGYHDCVFNSLLLLFFFFYHLFIASSIYKEPRLLHQNCLLVCFGLPAQRDLLLLLFFTILTLICRTYSDWGTWMMNGVLPIMLIFKKNWSLLLVGSYYYCFKFFYSFVI